jgi:hypothetical protein
MGSILRFERPRPVIRQPRAKVATERESTEAHRSFLVLIGSFFITALVMCVAVVAVVSSTWTDVLIMSAFVLVFALLKIALANALIYTMLRYDAASVRIPAQRCARAPSTQFSPFRQAPCLRGGRTIPVRGDRPRSPTSTLRPAPRR